MVIGAVAAPRRNFTRVDNRIIDDETLPGPARWVYTVLARMAPGRRATEEWLMRHADLARNKLRAALRALEDRGIIHRRQHNTRQGFGDVLIYVGDPPLPIDQPAPAAPIPVNAADQRKQNVSAGGTVDRLSGDVTTVLQDDVPQDLQVGVRTVRTGATPRDGEPQMTHTQTRLPIIVPRKPTGREIERTSPAPVIEITPAVASREAIRRVAATITGEWLDRCPHTPPRAVQAGVEAEIWALVCEGIPDDDIRRGVALWMGKPFGPSTIPSFVHQAMNGRALAAQQPGKRDRRVAAAVEIGARLQAEADARAAAS